MNTKKKDAIINRLLYVTSFSIIASIALWFIFIGYLHTKYILAMPKIMIALFITGSVVALWVGWKAYRSGKKPGQRMIQTLVVALAVAVSSLAIKYYILYAIYILWAVIAIYLLVNFSYYLFKLLTIDKNGRKK